MTSPLRGNASRSQGRRRRVQAAPAGEWLSRSARQELAARLEPGAAERHLQPTALPPQSRAPLASPQGEEVLRAVLVAAAASRTPIRYRGFVLLPQPDLGWLVRPERSPMMVLPFRTPPIALSDVKALVDRRLDGLARAGCSWRR